MPTAKILVLESERANAQSYAPALEKRGYAVVIEHDTAAALKRIQAQKPDVVVLDAASLKTSGERLVHRLRSSSAGLPIVLVVDKKNQPGPKCEASVVLVTPFTPIKQQTASCAASRWYPRSTSPLRITIPSWTFTLIWS